VAAPGAVADRRAVVVAPRAVVAERRAVAGLRVAGLRVAGLRVAVVAPRAVEAERRAVAGLRVAGLRVAGLRVAGLRVAGLRVAVALAGSGDGLARERSGRVGCEDRRGLHAPLFPLGGAEHRVHEMVAHAPGGGWGFLWHSVISTDVDFSPQPC